MRYIKNEQYRENNNRKQPIILYADVLKIAVIFFLIVFYIEAQDTVINGETLPAIQKKITWAEMLDACKNKNRAGSDSLLSYLTANNKLKPNVFYEKLQQAINVFPYELYSVEELLKMANSKKLKSIEIHDLKEIDEIKTIMEPRIFAEPIIAAHGLFKRQSLTGLKTACEKIAYTLVLNLHLSVKKELSLPGPAGYVPDGKNNIYFKLAVLCKPFINDAIFSVIRRGTYILSNTGISDRTRIYLEVSLLSEFVNPVYEKRWESANSTDTLLQISKEIIYLIYLGYINHDQIPQMLKSSPEKAKTFLDAIKKYGKYQDNLVLFIYRYSSKSDNELSYWEKQLKKTILSLPTCEDSSTDFRSRIAIEQCSNLIKCMPDAANAFRLRSSEYKHLNMDKKAYSDSIMENRIRMGYRIE